MASSYHQTSANYMQDYEVNNLNAKILKVSACIFVTSPKFSVKLLIAIILCINLSRNIKSYEKFCHNITNFSKLNKIH